MPVPSGLVRNSTSPGFAPALVRIASGSIAPVTAYPNLISGSCTVWPPSSDDAGFAQLVEPALEDSRG